MNLEELKAALDAAEIKQKDVAVALGVNPNKVSLSLNGKRRFTVEEMDIIRGMLAAKAPTDPQGAGRGIRAIPKLGSVPAGNWKLATEEKVGSIPAPDPSIPPNAYALDVDGDSMDLVLRGNGVIIVDPDDRDLFPGWLYVVRQGDETTFKEYQEGPARLVPCSSNPEHKDIMIGRGEAFAIEGRVIWSARRH